MINPLKWFKKETPVKIDRRSFNGAGTGRLFSAWTSQNYSADHLLRQSLATLRARSRELERNNDYAKKFFRMCRTNVVGKEGIKLQSQIVNDSGKSDDLARMKVEEAWKIWAKKKNCDVTQEYSFRDVQKMVISSLMRDGEVLIRLVKGYDNDFRFALQLIEADHLDEKYNDILANGNKIKMGKEFNQWGKCVAYWLYPYHPGDNIFGFSKSYDEKIRVPAEEIIHLYNPLRISQTRGLPALHSALVRLHMLGGYEEAELVASRISSSKMGFYKPGEEAQASDANFADAKDSEGNLINEVEPGLLEELPPGYDFVAFDPNHPTTAFKDFVKTIIRGFCAGMDVSYASLSGDLESVNYSSIRAGVLDERDVWRDLQGFMVEHFMQPVFEAWLEMALLTKQINLPFSKYDKFNNVKWQTRGWAWVDPLKDMQASKQALAGGLNTASDILGENGKDIEEVYKRLEEEEQLRNKYNVKTDIYKDAQEVIIDESE